MELKKISPPDNIKVRDQYKSGGDTMKQKSLNEKILRITPETLIVGIDVAKRIHWVRIINYRGIDLIKPFKINNTITGIKNLEEAIKKVKEKNDMKKVIVGMEPSGHYWKAIAWQMKLNEGVDYLVGVNPYHVKKSKELDDNSPEKSDRKDAGIIARLIRDGRYYDIYLPEGVYSELRIMATTRDRIVTKRKNAKNIVIAVMDEYFPEYEKVYKNIFVEGSIGLLKKYPFPEDIIKAGIEEIEKVLKESTQGKDWKKRAKKIYELAKKSIGVKEGQKSAKIKLGLLLKEIEFYTTQIEEIEKEIEKLIETTEIGENIKSVPGIGTVITATILGEIGEINRFNNWKEIRKLAGLNLYEISSGEHKGKTKITKRGRPLLRKIIYLMAKSLLKHNKEMKEKYKKLTKREKNPLRSSINSNRIENDKNNIQVSEK
jgi:transposase